MLSGLATGWDREDALLLSQPEPRGTVVVYVSKAHCNRHGHEFVTHSEVAKKLAAIKNCDFGGEFDSGRTYPGTLYFVPTDTLVGLDFASRLGIRGEQDLFGGVVPFSFVANKTITHPLTAPNAYAPEGWSPGLGLQMAKIALAGFSAFTLPDARVACLRLLEQGTVRVKKGSGIGGLGQWVVATEEALDDLLASLDADEVAQYGLVLERNLSQVTTHSVGQVRVGSLLATYYGIQQLTCNNAGQQVYGGSSLTVARGDFSVLLQLEELGAEKLVAIEQARAYYAAAMAAFPGMFASRCNYDVAQGFDDQGQWHSGVLESSWRIGGASGAEVEALAAFNADPELRYVRVSTVEVYGDNAEPPANAVVYFHGVDAVVGTILKYALVEPYVNAR